MSMRNEQCRKVCRILDDVLANRPTERDALIVAVRTAFDELKERKTGRWIPCSERLPKTHKAGNSFSGIFMQSKPVLVYGVPEYEREYSFNVVTYCDDLNGITYWSTEMDAVIINKVTAWMPLPEPYSAGTI